MQRRNAQLDTAATRQESGAKCKRKRNFMFWLDALNKVFEDIPVGTSDYKLAMVVRNSIANPEDKRNTQGMTAVTLHEITKITQLYPP